jgi:hypothetical protein
MASRKRVSCLEKIEILVTRKRDTLEDNQRTRDEREVLGYGKGEIEENLVEVSGDGGELSTLGCHRGKVVDAPFGWSWLTTEPTPHTTTLTDGNGATGSLVSSSHTPLIKDFLERRHERGAVDVSLCM